MLKERQFWWFLAIAGVLTCARIVALHFSVVDLFPDEAQYWAWAQRPAFGYFSKPPLLAWIIAGFGSVAGNSEAWVRAPAPLFYFGTALITYFIAHGLYDARVAFWSGLSLAFATGVVFSSRVISTDVPLLFFWTLALFAYVKLLDGPSWSWTIVLGLALGLGLLAKYAMVYFFLGMIAAAFIDARARALWRQPLFWFGLLLAFILLAPNLVWNTTHGFVTFNHTRGNIEGSGLRFDPLGALNLVASQFAVFGPIIFATFLLAVFFPRLFRIEPADRVLIAFAVPPLALIALTALLTSANANWAAPSAISLTIVAVALLVRRNCWRWLRASVGLGLVLQLLLPVADAFADRLTFSLLAKPDLYHRTMGWKALGAGVSQAAEAHGARSVVAEERDVVASLVYYLRDGGRPVLAWPTVAAPARQFDLDRPLTQAAPDPVLFITSCPLPQRLHAHYATVETLPAIEAASGPHSSRRFSAYVLSGARGEIARLGSCSR